MFTWFLSKPRVTKSVLNAVKGSGRCSLGFMLNGFILFFNNLEEAQRSIFMVRDSPLRRWVARQKVRVVIASKNLFNKFSKDVLVSTDIDASL